MHRRSDAEERLLEKARRYLPGGNGGNLALPTELNFLASHGKGSRIFDVSGNEYVDWLMGSGPMVLGHAHPAVTGAVIKAVEGGSTFFATNDRAVELAEELVNAIPCAEQVRFTTSGTDACSKCVNTTCRATRSAAWPSARGPRRFAAWWSTRHRGCPPIGPAISWALVRHQIW